MLCKQNSLTDVTSCKSMSGRRRPNKGSKPKKVKGGPNESAPRAPKPYLRVPEDFSVPNNEENGEENNLPKAEHLFQKHLFNQSVVSGW